LITKIQLAAMSRANIPLNQRRPFYLYVDEFQNFATDSFAVILSEARKYGLYLTVANQYVAQMPQEVRDAVFGNVGSMITFRVGADDAAALARYFEPIFEPNDLTNLSLQNVYVTMSIDGETSIPFSAKTLRVPDPEVDNAQTIIELSRQKFNSSREQTEQVIAEWSGMSKTPTEVSSHDDQPDRKTEQGTPQAAHIQTRPTPAVAGAQPKNYSQMLNQDKTSKSGSGQSGQSKSHSSRNRKRKR
jgi:hypothetical protein